MKHVVILAHPDPESFNASVARAYEKAAREMGHEAVVRDLYRMGFDPCLRKEEIPGRDGFAPGEDVVAERGQITDADTFALVYPLWFNAPPAILKGYVERVFGMRFGYEPGAGGGLDPLLVGRKLISFSSSGAPEAWVRDTGALQALDLLFDHHLAAVCGFTIVDHVHFGGVGPQLSRSAAESYLIDVRRVLLRNFLPTAQPT